MNNWEQFCAGFKDFINQPLSIILGTIISVVLVALTIIGKTSFGKKQFLVLKSKIEIASTKLKDKEQELENALESFKEFKESKEQEIKTLTNDFDAKLYAYKEEISKLETLCLNMAKNVNNKHIQELVMNYEQNRIDIDKLNVSDIVENAKKEVKEQFEEKVDELCKKVDEKLNELNKLNEVEKDGETKNDKAASE